MYIRVERCKLASLSQWGPPRLAQLGLEEQSHKAKVVIRLETDPGRARSRLKRRKIREQATEAVTDPIREWRTRHIAEPGGVDLKPLLATCRFRISDNSV